MKQRITYWIPVLVIAGMIFWFSSQPYEQQDVKPFFDDWISDEWMDAYFGWVEFDYAGHEVSVESQGGASFIEFFIRKGAHFTIFFLLGFFAVRAFLQTILPKRPVTSIVSALLFVILYAASDELHQHFTGNRTPLIHDVGIDSIGGLIGILVYTLFQKRKRHL